MNDRDWTLIKTIAEEKNLTKTAERLYLSQPAVTYRLRILEEEFGARLVVRTPNGVILTPQGELLVEYSADMLLRLARTKELISGYGDKVKGRLRIGSSAIYANYKLPRLLRGFLERYPEVEISLKTGRSGQVVRMLEREEVAVAIVRGEHNWKFESHLLSEEPVCLVSKRPLDLAELPGHPRIDYGTDTSLQEEIDDWWRLTFSTPSTASMVVDTMDTCLRMVVQDLGWAILPSIGLEGLNDLRIVPLRWPDGEALIRRSSIFCGSHAAELPALRAFVDFVIGETAEGDEARIAG
ncbi:MAG TPA: LysR family transcriptional regulator [Rectinemataceae bacterium]|nr:LysR family transcriptional regulator [Rectinemataceae bacterium]